MEPDVVRLYSSSPPPLDEGGEEEDEDEFGEFGGYCGGVSSSFSFSEFDTPKGFSQSQAAETSPPDLYITSTQNVSSSGKNTIFEEAEQLTEKQQASLASDSRHLVYENSVRIDDHENGELEVSKVVNGVPSSDLQGASSAFSNTGLHRIASFSVPQEFEASSTYREEYNGNSKLNAGVEQEMSTISCFNSTENSLPSSTESSVVPNQLLPASISPRDVSVSGGTVKYKTLCESHGVNTSEAHGDQSIEESKEKQGEEKVLSGSEEPPGEVQPQNESENFGGCSETLAEFMSKVDEELNEDFVEHKETAVELNMVVPGVELEGDFEEVNGTRVDTDHDGMVSCTVEDSVVHPTKEMDEDFGDFRDAVQGFTDCSQTEPATQEGFADFVTALSGCSTDDDFGDTDTLKEEEELPEEEKEGTDNDNEETWCSKLPPSDSFADFSSAPFGGLAGSAGNSWVAFGLQGKHEGQQEAWVAFDEGHQSNTATAPPCDSLQSDMLAGLSCKLQHLFQRTFPSEDTPEVTEVVTLQALLEPQEYRESCVDPVQGEAAAMWRHLLDPHSAHGLKVQWVGSHSNRILLDCLGIRNILFTGQKKQPLIVPMFAAGLGMLEPTKDPVKPSPTSPARLTPSSPGQGRSTLCTQMVSSLSCGEDGVDPELYELTTAKLESSNSGINVAEALNKLMETVEKTSTVARKPEREGATSEEAARVISVLPDLSFMRARVLMFPHTLTPAVDHL